VKLLLDENLSDRIVSQITDLFPESSHVKFRGLQHQEDVDIWEFARLHGYSIASKDSDFHQRSLLLGHPPKIVFLRIGNCSTRQIVQLLRSNYGVLNAFDDDPTASIVILPQRSEI